MPRPALLARILPLALAACCFAFGWYGPAVEGRQQEPPSDPPAAKPEPRLPELREELLARVERDQAARQELIALLRKQPPTPAADAKDQPQPEKSPPQDPGKSDATSQEPAKLTAENPVIARLREIDQENTRWMREVVQQHGWPGRSLVGQDGAHAAWLLLQHADQDPEFQAACLEKMKQAPAGEVSATDLAYLTDRVLLKQTGKQVYGTQVQQVNGKWQPLPLENPDKLEELRRQAGLPPLEEYLKFVEQMYSKGG